MFSSPESVQEPSSSSSVSFLVSGESAWISSVCSPAPPSETQIIRLDLLKIGSIKHPVEVCDPVMVWLDLSERVF